MKKSSLALTIAVFVLSGFFALFLLLTTYYINFWPTDSFSPYLPTAQKLFQLPYLSQMHEIQENAYTSLNMRGKESLILGIAIFQKILSDSESLFPNICVLIFAVFFSSILGYFILSKLFDPGIGFIVYLLFSTCFWPYMYMLQGAHQPLVLVNFLFSAYFLQISTKQKFFSVLAGMFFGFMMFSSPTAALYVPYFFIPVFLTPQSFSLKKILSKSVLFLTGMIFTIYWFVRPDPIQYLDGFIKFLALNRFSNHFLTLFEQLPINMQNFLMQNSPTLSPVGKVRWIWLAKYFFLVMPVMILGYVGGLIYFAKRIFLKKSLTTLFLVLISLSTPIAVETIGTVQFGRNYFSWIVGIVFLLGYLLWQMKKENHFLFSKRKKFFVGILLGLHIGYNLFIFTSDVLPSRMALTKVYFWLKKSHVQKLYVYENCRTHGFTINFLNNPKIQEKIQFEEIQTIKDVREGYIFIPPISPKMIWYNCVGTPFDKDPYLMKLFQADKIEEFSAVSFKTIGSSRFWTQEEEVCTYRDIIFQDISNKDRAQGKIYILDAKKIHKSGILHNLPLFSQ